MADVLDVISLADAKDELRLSNAANDAALILFVTAVSQRLDVLCGPIVARAVTEAHHGWGGLVRLRSYPVLSVTSVTEYSGTVAQVLTAETNAAKTTNDYWLDDRAGVLYRRSGGYATAWPWGAGNVVVVYQAGRFATTALVSAKFRLAARIMVKHFWRYEAGGGTQTFGSAELAEGLSQIATFAVPRVVAELLAGEVHHEAVVG